MRSLVVVIPFDSKRALVRLGVLVALDGLGPVLRQLVSRIQPPPKIALHQGGSPL